MEAERTDGRTDGGPPQTEREGERRGNQANSINQRNAIEDWIPSGVRSSYVRVCRCPSRERAAGPDVHAAVDVALLVASVPIPGVGVGVESHE